MCKLSICIPTYNRAIYLSEAIKSILSQLTEEMFEKVEVAVSDNCSNDNTQEVIEDLRIKYPKAKIVYHVNEVNIGPDKNFLKAVSISSGEYCWLLGSDDKVADGAVKRVIDQIDLKCTVYLSDRYNADCKNMSIFEIQRFFSPELTQDYVFEICDQEDWSFYLSKCRSLGALFSYISSVVFSKKEWDKILEEMYFPYVGTAYVHVAILLLTIKNNERSTIKYLHDPIVINRTGNDSFMQNRYQRTMLDFDGYIKLSEIFAENQFTKAAVRYVIKHEYPIVSWRLIVKTNKEEFIQLIKKLEEVGYSYREIEHIEMLRRYRYISLLMYVCFFIHKKLSVRINKYDKKNKSKEL